MAKNEKKSAAEPLKSDVISAPEKVADVKADEKTKANSNYKKTEIKEIKHRGHKFVLFIFLVLLGGLAFFALQLEQTKKQNAEVLEKLQAAYENKIAAINERVNTLNREVEALKARPIVEHAAGISENVLNQRIADLRNELIAYLPQADDVKENTANVKEKDKAKNAGESANTEVQTEIRTLNEQENKTQEVLLASGAIIIRELAEQGLNFAYEAEVLQILARGNELAEDYVRTVRMFADTGISGKQLLVRNFDKIFAQLNNTELKANQQVAEQKLNRLEKMWKWLVNAVVVKKGAEKPVFKPENDEVLELVHEGRLQEALNALAVSEKYAKLDSKPLNAWKVQVENYLKFSGAINGVIMNALANIRLKEMEHAAK